MEPVITVVIPVYNCEKYVARAIKSVLNQPCSDQVEVLAVDDGSKDKSGEVCDILAAEYENVRVLHQENGGVSSARNLGIEKAGGKYIAFLDSDDWWEPGFLDEPLVNEWTNAGADVYEFAYRSVDAYCSLQFLYETDNAEHHYDAPGFGRYGWQHPNSFCYKRIFLLENDLRYPLAKVGEDGPFVEMALFYAGTFCQRNKVLFSYWENEKSCLHTTKTMRGLSERYKARIQEEAFFKAKGVAFDADDSMAWASIANLPRICAESSFHDVQSFMQQGCERILARRPDIRYGDATWGKLESWRRNPRVYWLEWKIRLGIPLAAKNACYMIPGVRRAVNYLYNRFYRKMQPIKQ